VIDPTLPPLSVHLGVKMMPEIPTGEAPMPCGQDHSRCDREHREVVMEPLFYRCAVCGRINRLTKDKKVQAPRCGRCGNALDLHARPSDVNDAGLDRLIHSSPVPVLVDFWAPWCGPCRLMSPVIGMVAEKFAGRMIVAKVNTDQNQDHANALQIHSIPTLALWRDGAPVALQAGSLTQQQVEAFVTPHVYEQ
jgi:thioredoxin 2